MKKTFMVFVYCLLLTSLTSCGNNNVPNEDATRSLENREQTSNPSEIPLEPISPGEAEADLEAMPLETENNAGLVVYFSATGNTKAVAETLAKLQGADIYEIIPEQPYTHGDLNYNDRSTRATVEQNDETARPAISKGVENMADYDVVYVGFPIWWGDMPRILYTFFDTHDLSGKTIAPFCTSGGSGISRAVQSIGELVPSAAVTEGYQANSATGADGLIHWLDSIGLTEQEQIK